MCIKFLSWLLVKKLKVAYTAAHFLHKYNPMRWGELTLFLFFWADSQQLLFCSTDLAQLIGRAFNEV